MKKGNCKVCILYEYNFYKSW